MGHISQIRLSNYRSFHEATCRLSPLTLVVGRNNSGKSNFLRAFQDCAAHVIDPANSGLRQACHHQHESWLSDSPVPTSLELEWADGRKVSVSTASEAAAAGPGNREFPSIPEIHDFDPRVIGGPEPSETPQGVLTPILPDGRGVTSTLRRLRLGDSAQQRRFEKITHQWRECLPEITNLHFAESGPSRLMVEQDAIPGSRPLSDLSEGARLLLAMLTLVHQEQPPRLLLLEDFDHKLHARLFSTLVNFLRDLTRREGGPQIIATTHNPYLVDEFKEDPSSIVIVEKQEGRSTLANMDERLRSFLEEGEPLEMPLGQVLFSGLADGGKGPAFALEMSRGSGDSPTPVILSGA